MLRKTKEKRKELSLSDKVNVIKEFEKSGESQRLLAEQFGVGQTQIQLKLSNGRLSTWQHMKKTRIPAVNAYGHV